MAYADDNPVWGDLNKAAGVSNTGHGIIASEEVLNPEARKSNPVWNNMDEAAGTG
jgi:hypothetical protein